jgi:hypothetical protein
MRYGAEIKASIVAIVGAVLLILVGGVLALTTGLLFVTGVTSALIGLLAAGSSRPKPRVRQFAVGLAIIVVLVAALGTWAVSRAEGGSLGLLDFLWATDGILVPVELAIAIVAASWGARSGPIVA